MEWLPEHLPTNQRTTVVHGDFRFIYRGFMAVYEKFLRSYSQIRLLVCNTIWNEEKCVKLERRYDRFLLSWL